MTVSTVLGCTLDVGELAESRRRPLDSDHGLSRHDHGLGPVDYVVVELPDGFGGFEAPLTEALTVLLADGTVRVLDLLILHRAVDGTLDVLECEDLGGRLPEHLGDNLAELLAEEDLENLSAAITPGSSALILVWENHWACRFTTAAHMAGAKLVAQGRIPTQAIVQTLIGDEEA